MKPRAALLDRDGVLNEMVYYPEHGLVDSPFTPPQFVLVDGVGPALRGLKEAGLMLVVVSNQPGVAKRQFTMETFEKIREKMHRLLAEQEIELDAEYYCFHHPQAKFAKYKFDCDCRKPKPGMLLEAASDLGLDLANSVFIGDGLIDVMAGKRAGCKTVLVANYNALLGRMMDERGAEPDFLARNVTEAADIVKKNIVEIPTR